MAAYLSVAPKVAVPIDVLIAAAGTTLCVSFAAPSLVSVLVLRVWLVMVLKRLIRVFIFLIGVLKDLVGVINVNLLVSINFCIFYLVLVKLHISCRVDDLSVVHRLAIR